MRVRRPIIPTRVRKNGSFVFTLTSKPGPSLPPIAFA